MPYLARADAEIDATPARREAVDVVFQSFNRYLGVAVGEHLGYALTGTWTGLIGVAVIQSSEVPSWLGVLGLVIGPALALCALEFVGSREPTGWTVAERITPVAYVAWSAWLVGIGIAVLA